MGLIAGPKFFRDFRHNATSYILLGFVIILVGALCAVATNRWFGVSPALAVGLVAFTSLGVAAILYYVVLYIFANAGAFVVIHKLGTTGTASIEEISSVLFGNF